MTHRYDTFDSRVKTLDIGMYVCDGAIGTGMYEIRMVKGLEKDLCQNILYSGKWPFMALTHPI